MRLTDVLVVGLACVSVLCGCSTGPSKSKEIYIDANDVFRAVDEAVADCLAKDWYNNFQSEHGADRKPVIAAVYRVSAEDVADTPIEEHFINDAFEQTFINSGKVRVASLTPALLDQTREYRVDDEFRNPQFLKRVKAEVGADYFVVGTLGYMRNESRSGVVKAYQITPKLLDTETTELVWTKVVRIVKEY